MRNQQEVVAYLKKELAEAQQARDDAQAAAAAKVSPKGDLTSHMPLDDADASERSCATLPQGESGAQAASRLQASRLQQALDEAEARARSLNATTETLRGDLQRAQQRNSELLAQVRSRSSASRRTTSLKL